MNIGVMLGIAVALAVTSYRNEKMAKEFIEKKKQESLKNNVDLKLEPAKKEIIKEEKKEIKNKKNKKKN